MIANYRRAFEIVHQKVQILSSPPHSASRRMLEQDTLCDSHTLLRDQGRQLAALS